MMDLLQQERGESLWDQPLLPATILTAGDSVSTLLFKREPVNKVCARS